MNRITYQQHCRFIPYIILLLIALSSSTRARAATGALPPPVSTRYEFTIIDIPNQQFMAPFAPNEDGVACGYYIDNDGLQHGFLWRRGKVTPLDAPGAEQTVASAINDHGQVSGAFGNAASGRAFVYNIHNESWTVLPELPNGSLGGLPNTVINNRGTVVGSAGLPDGTALDWIWNGKSYSYYSPPGISSAGPLGINDRGQISGIYFDSQGTMHGFLKDGPAVTNIDVPGTDWTAAFSVNNKGEVAGTYFIFDPIFQEQGFIWRKGQFLNFPVPGYGGATGVNDQGEIAGTYLDASGVWHGFIATPEHERHELRD